MKVNELMVDDWVLWKDKPVQVASVSGIKYSFGHIDITLAHCNDEKFLESHDIKSIQPITLIPEILEKNGFVKELDSDGIHYRFTLIQGCSQFSLLYARSVFQWLYPIDFKYVHEFQHALKLCGIDKTIEL